MAMKGNKYGTHRVIEPQGVLTQAAWKIDNDMTKRYSNEIICNVTSLNIDSASFTQIEEACGGDEKKIGEMIMGIVAERGKQQNPVTGSGGMFKGEVAYIGEDLLAKPDFDLKVGDKIVTSVISCGDCYNCRMTPGRTNLCANQGVFGLIGDKRGTDEGNRANGWFADYMLIRGGEASGATFFQVNELNLNQRMILELACVCVHALERGQKTGLLNFGSKVLVQGCGPVGLVMITVLRAAGINHVIAVDGNEDRLKVAQKMGAKTTICFKRPDEDTLDKRVAKVQAVANGVGVDFAFQCTGAPVAAADIYAYIRRGGGMCEMGFFVNNGEYSVNPHFAMCNKEIDIVGSWDYSAEDYPKTVAFLKQCQEMNIPIEELITHTFPLDQMNEAMETNVAQKGIKIAYIAK